MKIRLAKRTEPYIKGTMVTPINNEIILKEKKTFKGQPIEDLMEEILVHEFIHIAIYDLFKDEIIAYTIDNLTKWTKDCQGYRMAFIDKKSEKIIFQTPT